jgi:hypothetical protein
MRGKADGGHLSALERGCGKAVVAALLRPTGLFSRPLANWGTGQLVPVAAQGKAKGGTDLPHSRWGEVGHAFPQVLLGHGYRVVKVHRARMLHAIVFAELDLGRHAPDAGRYGSNCGRGKILKGTRAGKYDDGPGFVRSSKSVEPNVPPAYASGQVAFDSQPDSCPESAELA